MIVVQLARPNPHFIKESCTVCEIPREDWKDSSTLSPKRVTISGLACVAYAESFCLEWRFLINRRLLVPKEVISLIEDVPHPITTIMPMHVLSIYQH